MGRRPRRANEVDGVDYVFVSREVFSGWVSQGAMLEHAIVYGDYKVSRTLMTWVCHENECARQCRLVQTAVLSSAIRCASSCPLCATVRVSFVKYAKTSQQMAAGQTVILALFPLCGTCLTERRSSFIIDAPACHAGHPAGTRGGSAGPRHGCRAAT